MASKPELKTASLETRMTPDLKRRVAAAARRDRVTPAEWLRVAAERSLGLGPGDAVTDALAGIDRRLARIEIAGR